MIQNEVIHSSIREANIKYWQVAAELKLNDGNFSRKLRFELSQAEKSKILKIIKKLKEKNNEESL